MQSRQLVGEPNRSPAQAVTGQVDSLISKITSALNDHGSDGEPEDMYDSLPSVDDEDLEDGGQDDEEEDGYSMSVGKRSINEHLRSNDTSDRPGSLKASTHGSGRHGSGRHKFEALRDAIVNEGGVPKSQAMHLARQRHPDAYDDYVKEGNSMGKSAPMDFDGAVEAEMRKHSLTREVAGQRISQMFGSALPRRIAKGEDANARFQKRVYDIADRDGCDLTEATRRARFENPNLVRAMNA
jgi:hypothetical protein